MDPHANAHANTNANANENGHVNGQSDDFHVLVIGAGASLHESFSSYMHPSKTFHKTVQTVHVT